jgi:hypothetical protein
MLVNYVTSRFNHRSVGKGKELLPATSWWQFPALLSEPVVEQRVLSQYRKIEIPNKTNRGNICIAPRYMNVEIGNKTAQFHLT